MKSMPESGMNLDLRVDDSAHQAFVLKLHCSSPSCLRSWVPGFLIQPSVSRVRSATHAIKTPAHRPQGKTIILKDLSFHRFRVASFFGSSWWVSAQRGRGRRRPEVTLWLRPAAALAVSSPSRPTELIPPPAARCPPPVPRTPGSLMRALPAK